jgi:hypothetical protein
MIVAIPILLPVVAIMFPVVKVKEWLGCRHQSKQRSFLITDPESSPARMSIPVMDEQTLKSGQELGLQPSAAPWTHGSAHDEQFPLCGGARWGHPKVAEAERPSARSLAPERTDVGGRPDLAGGTGPVDKTAPSEARSLRGEHEPARHEEEARHEDEDECRGKQPDGERNHARADVTPRASVISRRDASDAYPYRNLTAFESPDAVPQPPRDAMQTTSSDRTKMRSPDGVLEGSRLWEGRKWVTDV